MENIQEVVPLQSDDNDSVENIYDEVYELPETSAELNSKTAKATADNSVPSYYVGEGGH